MFYLTKHWNFTKNIGFPQENQCFASKTYVLLNKTLEFHQKHWFSSGKPMFCFKNICFTAQNIGFSPKTFVFLRKTNVFEAKPYFSLRKTYVFEAKHQLS